MMKQISIFAENKKGTLQKITEILADENINILGSVTNDSAEYGIVRMVLSDPEKAQEAMTKAGYLCQLSNVIGVEIQDEPGNMNRLLNALKESNISVNYIYLSFKRSIGSPVLVFHADEADEVEACIASKGFHVVDDFE